MTAQLSEQAVVGGVSIPTEAIALFGDIAPAMIVHRLMVVGDPCDAAFLDRLVDDVLLPFIHAARAPPRESMRTVSLSTPIET